MGAGLTSLPHTMGEAENFSWAQNICVIAAEASGDVNAAILVESLKTALGEKRPKFWGIAGPRMRAAGVEAVYRVEELAVMGFAEVLGKYLSLRNIHAGMKRALEKRRPDLVILVDAPSFNMPLAAFAFSTGAVVHYHIPPKVWAHGAKRIEELEHYCYGVTCVLPFEESLLRAAQVHAQYVGHPLKDQVTYYLREHGSFMSGSSVRSGTFSIGLLPGSRVEEVEQHLDILVQSLERLRSHFERQNRKVIGLIPVAETLDEKWFAQRLAAAMARTSLPETAIRLMPGAMYRVLGSVQYAWICSGTAALEACFFELPFSVIYRTSWWTYAIAKRIAKVEHISLVNLVAGRTVVPEFIQDDVTIEHLCDHAVSLLSDEGQLDALKAELRAVNRLFPEKSAERAADAVMRQMAYWAPIPRESRARWQRHHMGT